MDVRAQLQQTLGGTHALERELGGGAHVTDAVSNYPMTDMRKT
jgi:hypothetical protein